MDNTTTRIGCVYSAIEDGTIEGDFTEGFKSFVFDPIKTIDKDENESTWEVIVTVFDTEKDKIIKFKKNMIECGEKGVNELPPNIIGIIQSFNHLHTGTISESEKTKVLKGKNKGKKNATNAVSQAVLQANRLYLNKLKKTPKGITNILPMLVKKYGSSKKSTLTEEDLKLGVYIEPKLDGVRMVSYKDKNDIKEYSRSGIYYKNLNNIENDLKSILINNNLRLDGEVYLHGKPLQDISGAIRGNNEITGSVKKSDLEYIIFDCFNTDHMDRNQDERKEIIYNLLHNKEYKYVKLVKSKIVHSMEDIQKEYDKYISEGYEGAIVRKRDKPYDPSINNSHSDYVLKVKPFNNSEFKIIGYTKGSKGKEAGAVIFILETDKGNKFNAIPKMPIEVRKELYDRFKRDKDVFDTKYLNKMATIQYSNLSKDGKPQQPKFITVRDYE